MKIINGKQDKTQSAGKVLVRNIKTCNIELLGEKLYENKPLNRADKRFLKKLKASQ